MYDLRFCNKTQSQQKRTWQNGRTVKKYKLSAYYSTYILSVFTQRYKRGWRKDGNEGECYDGNKF